MKKIVILGLSLIGLTTLTMMSFKMEDLGKKSTTDPNGKKKVMAEVKGSRSYSAAKKNCINVKGNCLKDVIVKPKKFEDDDMIRILDGPKAVIDFFGGANWQTYFPEVINNDEVLNDLRNGMIKFDDNYNSEINTHFYLGTHIKSGEIVLVSPFVVE